MTDSYPVGRRRLLKTIGVGTGVTLVGEYSPVQRAHAASSGDVILDGFEDGDTKEWVPVVKSTSTLEASQERVFSGSWSAKFTEGDSDSDRPEWERVGN